MQLEDQTASWVTFFLSIVWFVFDEAPSHRMDDDDSGVGDDFESPATGRLHIQMVSGHGKDHSYAKCQLHLLSRSNGV